MASQALSLRGLEASLHAWRLYIISGKIAATDYGWYSP